MSGCPCVRKLMHRKYLNFDNGSRGWQEAKRWEKSRQFRDLATTLSVKNPSPVDNSVNPRTCKGGPDVIFQNNLNHWLRIAASRPTGSTEDVLRPC